MKRTISRRLLLRGAGSVAIALPLLEEFQPRRVAAAPGETPIRVVTAFFGLGLDPKWQQQKFEGPLAPYESLSGKMAFFTNVNMKQGSGGAHCENSPVVFVGEKNQNENRSGGASIDQLIRAELDPSASTLASGLWWRRGACDAQALRVWNVDGTARPPVKRPSEVFDKLFGSIASPEPSGEPDPGRVLERHLKRSVLDTVVDQYRYYTGDRSPLGAASKEKLRIHLTSIREIETQLAPADAIVDPSMNDQCVVPSPTSDPEINADYDKFTYGTGSGSPEISWQDFQMVYRLHADLWVAALRCDLVRFGNLMFESAGGHTNFSGTYAAMGETTSFPDDSQHDSYFHDNKPLHARLYQHFAQTNLAYFLQQLESVQEGDGTLLDNTTVVIGTEYGWNHSSEGVFHAIAGGKGRFRSGFYENRVNAIDVYNAVLQGHGLEASVGSRTNVDSEGDASAVLL